MSPPDLSSTRPNSAPPCASRSPIQLSRVGPASPDSDRPSFRRTAITASPVLSCSAVFAQAGLYDMQLDKSTAADRAAATMPHRRAPLELNRGPRRRACIPVDVKSVALAFIIDPSSSVRRRARPRPRPSLGHEAEVAPSQAPDTARDSDTAPQPRPPRSARRHADRMRA